MRQGLSYTVIVRLRRTANDASHTSRRNVSPTVRVYTYGHRHQVPGKPLLQYSETLRVLWKSAGTPVTLADLVAAESVFKKARVTYEELNRTGAGGSFVVQGVAPFAFPAIAIEVKPRSPYQRFYHHVTSAKAIDWLATTYGDRLRGMLHAARAEPGLCRLVGAGKKRGRLPVVPAAHKSHKQVALSFAPCLALVANDSAQSDADIEGFLALDILNAPQHLLDIPAVRDALLRWQAAAAGGQSPPNPPLQSSPSRGVSGGLPPVGGDAAPNEDGDGGRAKSGDTSGSCDTSSAVIDFIASHRAHHTRS